MAECFLNRRIIQQGGGGGDGITTNQIIRAMDLSITLIDQKTILTESDYTNASIETMIELLDKSVYGGE